MVLADPTGTLIKNVVHYLRDTIVVVSEHMMVFAKKQSSNRGSPPLKSKQNAPSSPPLTCIAGSLLWLSLIAMSSFFRLL